MAHQTPASDISPGAFRVLVVDDHDDFRQLVARTLSLNGMEPILAANGAEGLHSIKQGGAPDVVVTDWEMPRLSAKDFILELKSQPGCAEIPVVLMSSGETFLNDAREMNLDGYFLKGSATWAFSLATHVQGLCQKR